MPKLLQWISYITLVAAIILIIATAVNLLYPYPTIEVKQPAPILNPTLHQGDTLTVIMNYDKQTDHSARVQRAFIDGVIYSMPVYKSSYVSGKHTVEDVTTQIPDTLPPGTYYMHVILEYDFPPFRTMTYSFNTEKFTIVQ